MRHKSRSLREFLIAFFPRATTRQEEPGQWGETCDRCRHKTEPFYVGKTNAFVLLRYRCHRCGKYWQKTEIR